MGSKTFTIYENTDMVMEVGNLRDAIAGTLITGATVTFRLLGSDGAAITGVADPVTVTEVALPAKGLYRGTIVDTAVIVTGHAVTGSGTLVLTAIDVPGIRGEWTLDWIAEKRRS